MKILKPIGFDDEWLTLTAIDDAGGLLIRVDLATWEKMKEQGSDWMNTTDRQDLALSLVGTWAGRATPADSPQGRLITLV
jgi:hypothetical protein